MSELNEVVHEEHSNTPQVTCPIDYKPSLENLLSPICVQVGLCVCVCVTGVNECVFVRGRRQGQAMGLSTVGSITHGLKIKSSLKSLQAPG